MSKSKLKLKASTPPQEANIKNSKKPVKLTSKMRKREAKTITKK